MDTITWISHTFMIGDKAFKNVRPMSVEIIEETEEYWDGYLWWRKEWTESTGRWYLKLVYDRGPMTGKQVDHIYFDKESVARSWFTAIYNECFLTRDITQQKPSPTPTPPSPKKPNKPSLRLL